MPPSRHPHAPNTFRLLTLGRAVLVDSAAVPVGEQRRRLALLALLAAAGDRGVSRDVLMSRLSPESPTASARHALHQLLYYLRQQAGEQVFLGTDPVRLNPAIVSSDLGEFEAALDRGALADAVGLYRGPFLEGFHLGDSAEFEDWAAAERMRLAGRYAEALAALAAEADAARDSVRAIEWWSRLVTLDPLSGRATLGLMQALASAGDGAGALRLAQAHEARLQAELGVGVDAQVARLAATLQDAGRRIPEPDRTVNARTGMDPPPAALAHTDRPSPRKRLLLAGSLGAALTITAVAVLGSGRSPPPPVTGRQGIAVLPFRVESADSSLAWLGNGMVELLTIRLAGNSGTAVTDPGRVLPVWRRAVAKAEKTGEDPLPELAAGIGAQRVVQGSVLARAERLILTASLRSLSEPGDVVRAEAEGDADSLTALVDRMAAQLLGLGAGVERFRLASLTSASPAAIRAFLAARDASRRGRFEQAVQGYREAVRLDSTFALAGLELSHMWAATDEDRGLGAYVARANRDRLGGPDRALLDAGEGGVFLDRQALFRKLSAAVAAYPDRPETWYGLGDAYFHWGLLAGIQDPLRRAQEAFQRGWQLDSAAREGPPAGPVVEPLIHLVELAHLRGDTAEVRRWTAHILAADSSSEQARALEWHRAALEPEPERRAYWSSLGAGSTATLFEVANFITWTGEGGDDEEAVDRLIRRLRTVEGNWSFMLTVYALNRGRPDEAEAATDGRGGSHLRDRLRWALWWDGDLASAVNVARELRRSADGPPASGTAALRSQYEDICALGLWRAARGELAAARPAVARLRAAHATGLQGSDSASAEHFSRLCAELLDAAIATGERRPEARASIARADSLAREFIFEVCCGEAVKEANLVLARLWEEEGDLPRALQAVRRRAGGYLLAPLFQSTFLREEGRLAALVGDTAGAIQAYRHYLVLRSDPERALQPQRDSIYAELRRLEQGTVISTR